MSDPVEQLFANFGVNPFAAPTANQTPQEHSAFDINGNPQPAGWIADGAVLNVAKFAAGIRPVQLVDSLPVLPDADYPPAGAGQEGSVVLLTTDGKIYRNVGDVWTAAVGAVDGGIEVVDALPSLPDTDYPQGATVFLTSDEKLYRNTDGSTWSVAVDGGDIEAGTVTTNAIEAGAITAAKIASHTITASEIAAGTITSSEIAADTITAGNIASGAIGTSELAVGAQLTGDYANETGATPGVFIDSTGILVRDGKLTLEDEFGATQMAASGFSGSWGDFIGLGLYNCRFAAGTAGTVGTGRTSALPYWTVANDAGTPTLTFLNPGLRIQWAAINTTKRITSDLISVVASRPYEVQVTGSYVNAAGTIGFSAIVSWYKADGSASSTPTSTVVSWSKSTVQSGVLGDGAALNYGAVSAPADAYFATLAVTFSETVAHSSSNKIEVLHVALRESTRRTSDLLATSVQSQLLNGFAGSGDAAWYSLTEGSLRLGNTVGSASVQLGDGTTLDVMLSRDAINTLLIDDGSGGDIEVDVTGALNVSGVLTTGTVVVLGGLLRANVATISIDANQNNWNPTGLGSCTLLRISGLTATRTITGIVAGTQGDILILDNDSGSSLVLASDSASSTAANQLRLPAATSITIRARGMVGLVYDNSRWRAFSVAA